MEEEEDAARAWMVQLGYELSSVAGRTVTLFPILFSTTDRPVSNLTMVAWLPSGCCYGWLSIDAATIEASQGAATMAQNARPAPMDDGRRRTARN